MTEQAYAPALAGLGGANETCAVEADEAGLPQPGRYRAFLAVDAQPEPWMMITASAHEDVAFVLPEGTRVTTGPSGFDLSSPPYAPGMPIDRTASGELFVPLATCATVPDAVWVGLRSNPTGCILGTASCGLSTPSTCGNWAGVAGFGSFGTVSGSASNWALGGTCVCADANTNTAHLYCFEVP